MQPSTVSQEPAKPFGFVFQLGSFVFNSSVLNPNLHWPYLSNFLYFDARQKPKAVVSLSLSTKGAAFSIRRAINQFNSAVRFHCERIPLGFASFRVDSGENNGCADDGIRVLEESEGVSTNAVVSDSPKKVLILMSDTGGGHRASAEAIKAAFSEEFGDDYQVFVTDLWTEHTPWPFNQLPKSYNFLVKHGTLWKMTYYASAPRVIHRTNFAATSTFIAREVAKGLMKYQPDIIISVHPLMQHVPLRILRAKGLLKKIVFTTVVTDLSTCHPTWFHKLVTRCYCPSEEVAKRALRAGLQRSQIKVCGLPVRPSFLKAVRPKGELRKELGMDEHLPAVLLMGGGEGMGPIESTARALGDALYDETRGQPVGQVLVICGRNKKLANNLQSIDWKIPVEVKGFVTKMEEYMGACDCIITKAGPGTIAEAMIRGLPIILNDYIAGQEAGNVPYVVQNGCGKFSKSPKEIARIVSDWFGPKQDELMVMSRNALRLARPDAVFKIVHDLHELVQIRRPNEYMINMKIMGLCNGSLGAIAMLFLSVHTNLHIILALIALTAASASVAIADVTVDACVAHKSGIHLSLAADMQSLCALSSSIGSLVGFSFSGIFVHLIGPQGVYGLLTIPAGLVLLVGVLLKEHRSSTFAYEQINQSFVNAGKSMWKTFKCPQVWRPCLYMYLSFSMSLNISEGMFYWATDSESGPSFSKEIIGYIMAIGSIGSLLGAILYQYGLKDYPFRDLLFWAQTLSSLSGMIDLALVLRWNLKLGIPDFVFAVVDSSVSHLIGRLKWMPLLVLSSKLCPPGIEGTFFALLMSIDNAGLLTSSWLGGLLLHVLNVTRTRFDNIWLAILVRSIVRVGLLFLLFLVPRADPGSSILPEGILGSEEVEENRAFENVELVALVSGTDGDGR